MNYLTDSKLELLKDKLAMLQIGIPYRTAQYTDSVKILGLNSESIQYCVSLILATNGNWFSTEQLEKYNIDIITIYKIIGQLSRLNLLDKMYGSPKYYRIRVPELQQLRQELGSELVDEIDRIEHQQNTDNIPYANGKIRLGLQRGKLPQLFKEYVDELEGQKTFTIPEFQEWLEERAVEYKIDWIRSFVSRLAQAEVLLKDGKRLPKQPQTYRVEGVI